MPGIREARSENVILFDADCRIPDATALIDWYIEQFRCQTALAYTRVDYYDLPPGMAARSWLVVHHLTRWVKRVVLGIPTSRGSNYAILKALMIALYDQGAALYDIKVGPAVKAAGGKVVYSAARPLTVLTSGRNFSGGWGEFTRYLAWRISYYRRVKPMRPDHNPPPADWPQEREAR